MNNFQDFASPATQLFCSGGGCTAKLGAGVLSRVLERLPRSPHPDLLVGYDCADDAAVWKISPDCAIVQTLDFFPPMVSDPYLFGQIAATNALSDVFAMGGQVLTALNIVCFPQDQDLNILGAILAGGELKVRQAGGVLAGGHSINDTSIKYGLSVTGQVHPDHIFTNNAGRPGDKLILTKKLGTGLICAAARAGQADAQSLQEANDSMTTLNKTAADICRREGFRVHALTDVTGFGFLGHLHEMMGSGQRCRIEASSVPRFSQALHYADEFLLTAAAQRTRNHLEGKVAFAPQVSFAFQELLFDPQTSGGLLVAVDAQQAGPLERALQEAGLPACVVGTILQPGEDAQGAEISVV